MATIHNGSKGVDTARKGLLARYPLVSFFFLAFVLTWGYFWLIWAPLHLPDSLIALGGFAPAVSAFLVLAATSRKPGVLRMLRSIVHWRVGVQWYLVALLIALIGTLSMSAYGQSPSPASGAASVSASLLTRKAVIPISTVRRFFPQVDQEVSTGSNLTAVANPKATRSVIYTNRNASKKVTITVDQYASSSDASSAYEEAVQRSKTVPGYTPISAPNLGQNAFMATVTRGEETHVGFGALHGEFIVAITLAGYQPTPGTITKLRSLAREEEASANVP